MLLKKGGIWTWCTIQPLIFLEKFETAYIQVFE